MSEEQQFKAAVRAYARDEWRNPLRRRWAAEHGMRSFDAFAEDCLRVAREARNEGVPWADALDA